MELFPYQKEGVRLIDKFGGNCLLADSPGLGKSSQSIYWVGWRQKYPCLIVCPASLKENWKREIGMWVPGATVQILDSTTKHLNKCHFTILNYDILDKMSALTAKMKWETILFDESHYIKNPKTIRTKASYKLCKIIPNRIFISGTPVMSRPSELFVPLNIINPGEFPSYYGYMFRYCGMVKTRFGMKMTKPTNVKELSDKLSKLMIRRLKQDVLPDLPPKIHQMVPFLLDNRVEYDKASQGFQDWKRGKGARNAIDGLAKIEYMKQACVKGKTKQIIEWIEDFLESGEPLVFFGIHKEFLHEVHNHFKARSCLLTGETKVSDRDKIVQSFQAGKTQLFIGNIQAAGVGITLTRASHVAIAELPWTPAELSQSVDRCHRIGSVAACVNIYYLLTEGTIEEKIYDILMAKQKVVNNVLDKGEGEDLKCLSQLMLDGME